MRIFILALALLSFSAPARAEDAPAWMAYKNPYAATQIDLNQAHRTNEEVIAWASRAVAEGLSLPARTLQDRIKSARGYFAAEGWKGYADHLRASGILEAAQGGVYDVTTVADGDPMLINSGAMQGAWHWEVRVPVITTVAKHADGEQHPVSTKRARITALIARVETGGTDGLAIRSWSVE